MYKIGLERSRACEGFKLPLEMLLVGIASVFTKNQLERTIGRAVAGIGAVAAIVPGARASGRW